MAEPVSNACYRVTVDERVARVRTAVGELYIQRLGREVGRAPALFMNEAEAIAFLGAP